jgi:hypothetical protein
MLFAFFFTFCPDALYFEQLNFFVQSEIFSFVVFFDSDFFILQISQFLVILFFINVSFLLDLIKFNL